MKPTLNSPEHPEKYTSKSSNTSRKVSGPVVDSEGSAQCQIWPYSSLYLLSKATVTPKVHSLKLWGFNSLHLWLQEIITFLFFGQIVPGFGPSSSCRPPSGVHYLPKQERQRPRVISAHLLTWAGEREGMAATFGMYREVPAVVETSWVMLQPEGGHARY